MNRPTALLAEDEPLLRAELKEGLARAWPELRVVAEAGDGAQAIEAIERARPDVLFLDIEMPERDGLQVARAASGRCHVVFVTAYSEHAVAAFEQGAVDYLLKPLAPERLAAAVTRLRERLHTAPAPLDALVDALRAQLRPERAYLRWLSVPHGRGMRLLTCEEICYFQADNKYTQVVTANAAPLIGKTIRQLVAELDPQTFLQIHRGTIVNLQAIDTIDRDLRGNLSLRLRQRPERLAVSASFAHVFKHL